MPKKLQNGFTPYLASHPELQELVLRDGFDMRALIWDGERGSVAVFEKERLVWSSGEKDLSNSPDFDSTPFYLRDRRHLRVQFSYTRYFRSRPYRAVIRVPSPVVIPLQQGRFRIRVPVAARGPSIVRIARRRVAGMIRRSPARRVPNSRANPVRPNEAQNRPFLEVTESSSGKPSFTYSVSQIVRSIPMYSRSWTGVRTPNYSRLKPSQLPVNPHSVTISTVETDGPLVYLQDWRGSFGGDLGFANEIAAFTKHFSVPALPEHLALARNNAIRSLITRTGTGIQANFAQNFAQMRQMYGLIAQNALTIASSMRQLKRGNIPSAISTLFAGRPQRFPNGRRPSVQQSLANNWLQLQYGWKPLIQDIKGVLQSLPSLQLGNQGFLQRVTASGTAFSNSRTNFASFTPNMPTPGEHNVQTQTTVRMVLRYKVASAGVSFLAQTGFTNPLNLGWELLPFSFVVDWFVGIGPYLEARSAWDGLTFVDGSQTTFTRQIVASSISGQRFAEDSHYYFLVSGVYRRTDVKLDRVKLTTFPILSSPTLGSGLTSYNSASGDTYYTRAVNAIALLQQTFRL